MSGPPANRYDQCRSWFSEAMRFPVAQIGNQLLCGTSPCQFLPRLRAWVKPVVKECTRSAKESKLMIS